VIEAWQEVAGRVEQTVTVADGEQRSLDLTFGG